VKTGNDIDGFLRDFEKFFAGMPSQSLPIAVLLAPPINAFTLTHSFSLSLSYDPFVISLND